MFLDWAERQADEYDQKCREEVRKMFRRADELGRQKRESAPAQADTQSVAAPVGAVPAAPVAERGPLGDDARHMLKHAERVSECVDSGDLSAMLGVVRDDLLLWATSLKDQVAWYFHNYGEHGGPVGLYQAGMRPFWFARPILGATEAYEMIEFQKGAEQAQAFKRRFDRLDSSRREFLELLVSYGGPADCPDYYEFQAAVDDARSTLRKTSFSFAEYLRLLQSQTAPGEPAAGKGDQGQGTPPEYRPVHLAEDQRRLLRQGILSLTLGEAHRLAEWWDVLAEEFQRAGVLSFSDEHTDISEWLANGRQPWTGTRSLTLLEDVTAQLSLLAEALGVDSTRLGEIDSTVWYDRRPEEGTCRAALGDLNRLYRRLSYLDESARWIGKSVEECTVGELTQMSGKPTESARVAPAPGRREHEVPAHEAHCFVVTHEGQRYLDEAGYRQIAAGSGDYEVFADELLHEARRRHVGEPLITPKIPASYFQVLRAIVETRGYYDPNRDDPPREQRWSAKQIVQRARKAVDISYRDPHGKKTWRLFKTHRPENRAVYHFNPDPGFRFALIFLPHA
jgi:hypothetical protein